MCPHRLGTAVCSPVRLPGRQRMRLQVADQADGNRAGGVLKVSAW
jgi:hypothetical protein